MSDSRYFLPRRIVEAMEAEFYRYIVFVSGRGCAKTWSIARWLLARGTQSKIYVGCFREWMNSIAESNHKVLKQQIDLMGLDDYYDVGRDVIRGSNGTEFVFAGLRTDPRKVKGMEGMNFAWVDEAAKVPKESWSLLGPTLFRNKGARMIVSFNPEDEEDPSSQMFIVKPVPDSLLVRLTHEDNPFFSDEMKAEMIHAYATDPEMAANVWGGEFRTISDAQIFRDKYVVESFEPNTSDKNWYGPYFGMDLGYSQDPSVVMKLWVFDRKLFVEHEAYAHKCDLNGLARLIRSVPDAYQMVKLGKTETLIPAAQQYVIQCESAEPREIDHLKAMGFNIHPVKKYPGSVESGITFLRSFDKIVVHPRCTNLVREARLYSYKVDRLTGKVMRDIVDKHNHCWDAIRYAVEPMINTEHEEYVVYDSQAGFAITPDLDSFDREVSGFGMGLGNF